MADHYKFFEKLGAEIYSVSTDTHFAHKAWADASDTIKKIEYPMLADPTLSLSKKFGVLVEAAGVAERGTFLMNPEGKIVYYEISSEPVGRSAKELIRKLHAAKHVYDNENEVAPAAWEPGKETLKPGIDLVGKL